MIDYGFMFESILNSRQIDTNLRKAYEQKYSFFYINYLVCLSSIFLIFFLDISVICKVNSPLMERFLKIALAGLKTIAMLMSVSTFSVYGLVESTLLTQFIHTKTALGCDFNYEIESILSKLKGNLIAGSLSRKSM